MAAAGAKAGEAAASWGAGAGSTLTGYSIERVGARPARSIRRITAITTFAVLAMGGVAFASYKQLGGHARPAGAAPSLAPARPRAVPASSAPLRRAPAVPAPGMLTVSPTVVTPSAPPPQTPPASPAPPAPPAPPALPAPRGTSASPPPLGPGLAASLEVAGVGCPSDGDDTFTVHNAPTGPGWMPAGGGGWTGNGCDGSTLWTLDPNGNQPTPSTLTWTFSPAAGSARCTLAVFVPTQNALGESDYSVSIGPAATSQAVASVPVSQAGEAGQWLTLGTFTVSGSRLEITAAPASAAPGPGHHGAIAASAASALCT